MKAACLVLAVACLGAGLSACAGRRLPRVVYEGDVSRRDSVLTSGRGLVRLVYYVDQYSRGQGALPAVLEPVLSAYPRAREQERDVWGRGVQYRVRGEDYELRSAGKDGIFATRDDIVVQGQMGRNIPCELRDEDRVLTYDDLAPRCPPASTGT
jgi:hypothetical protein